MTKVNFSSSDFNRSVADSASLMLKNRFFEQNPSLTDDGASLIARPGLKKFIDIGNGPIRGMETTPGAFNGDLFVVSYDSMYRVNKFGESTLIKAGLFSPEQGSVKIQIAANIGDTPEYMFFCDGRNLFVYVENGFATNTLSGTAANNDVVRIDDVYYRFTNASVDTGTPDGSSGNPWLVSLGASNSEAITNLADAIGTEGIEGSQYSSGTTTHPTVEVTFVSSDSIIIVAKIAGLLGNGIITTETGAALAWAEGGTLINGGQPSCSIVQTPDDVGVIDIAIISSYLVVIPAQGEGINGRFYWIEPGEITIDPLNFATAERNPDGISQVLILGDQIYLMGDSTIEVWYVSGSQLSAIERVQGVVFDRGVWGGTGVKINDTLFFVDAEGGVFKNSGGGITRISTPNIEEQIRKAISKQMALTIEGV